MTCKKCGADAPEKAAFCPQCGAQLTRAQDGGAGRPAKAARMEPTGGRAPEVPEEGIWEGRYSPKAVVGAYVGLGLVAVVALVVCSFTFPPGMMLVGIIAGIIAIYLALMMLYERFATHYQLTTHRLVIQRGLLSRVDDRILLVDIDDITVRQGLIDRMLLIGTIVLHTSDETSKEESPDPGTPNRGIVRMKGIENPRHVGDVIDHARRAERSRRGVYMMNLD